jgi:hypothetical protein
MKKGAVLAGVEYQQIRRPFFVKDSDMKKAPFLNFKKGARVKVRSKGRKPRFESPQLPENSLWHLFNFLRFLSEKNPANT